MTVLPDDRSPLLELEGLRVGFHDRAQDGAVVDGVGLTIHAGRVTAIVGESGSGKSVTARSLLGLAGETATVSTDRFRIGGVDVSRLSQRQWREHRGKDIGFILQDALTSLDPLRPIGREVEEALTAHRWGDRRTRAARVIEALHEAGLPDAEELRHARPGELSGGQRQRALIAQALAMRPPILIADEPTTSLDVTVQAQILDLFQALTDRGHGILLISHDLGVVSRLADTILVLRSGVVVEEGDAAHVLSDPKDEYTKQLLDSVPDPSRRRSLLANTEQPGNTQPGDRRLDHAHAEEDAASEIAVEALHLRKTYRRRGKRAARAALDDVSFSVKRGATLGIVGESGSGKSTLAWIVAGLKSADEGSVAIFGDESPNRRGRRRVQVVYQDPLSSFDPRHTVGAVLRDALAVNDVPASLRGARVTELLEQVGLSDRLADRRPIGLSGGQRQRLAIARALACEPDVLVLDEPVSALDASVQARVLDLLTSLQGRLGLTYLFVSHDLGVVHHMSDDVIVMQDGRIVEHGEADELFTRPQHPYTRQLIAAVPVLPSRGAAVADADPHDHHTPRRPHAMHQRMQSVTTSRAPIDGSDDV